MKIIGYQGIEGSNSEEAARLLAEQLKIKDFILLPLVSSLNVLSCVESEKTDYGVIAVKNNHGGIVQESKDALLNSKLKRTGLIEIDIHHYLFVKDDTVTAKDIKFIASHPQAFIQCQNTLKNDFEGVELVADEDTATAAKKLANGIFSSQTAVLCRKNAGVMNNLFLLREHLEDNNDNKTTFELYQR